MKQNPTISIIVPVYNVKSYLKKCIKSILNQTFKDFELLLIDDGSTDGSGKICDEFALQDERVKVFHQANKGLQNARNTGLKEAKGEWIGFVDSDDFCEKDMFEVLLKNALENKVDFSVCDFSYVKENGTKYSQPKNLKGGHISTNKALHIWLDKHCFIMCWNILVKAEILKQNDIDFDEKFKLHEDMLFIYKVLKKVDKIHFCKNQLYNYLQRENSLSKYTKLDEKKMKTFEMFDLMISLEEDEEIKNILIKNKILRAFFLAKQCLFEDVENIYLKSVLKIARENFIFAMKSKDFTRGEKISAVLMFFPKLLLVAQNIKNKLL